MRRISVLCLLAAAVLVASASATPNPNSAFMKLRVFNDCPTSTVTTNNNYPASLWIDDDVLNCTGFANLHVWRFSEDGATAAEFVNGDAFRFCADLVISGTAEGEAGLQVSPWWSLDVDGRFNVRTTDGEIACFGGRLPFYTFTGSHGVTYVKGTTIHLEISYLPNDLSAANPATIEYKLTYNSIDYTSGPLAFDQGNPAEDPPHGVWGMLTPANVGGYVQCFLQAGNPDAQLRAEWSNICFEDLSIIAVESNEWGKIKALYR